ncbi:uncharacterized protein LOC119638332 [Glossina fuscipes]|uniref:Uncharacterized protein LOC119638332 n=1 Tax=Glossina fuscipes TaxID=7396 RepID=A0A9C5Z6Y9_9MUSC|nr:uncharacterized protein LOC119638332 [Glossina fuscipes]KAI9580977.1 hypothetical protein GQX74_011119 [Glossina fuscipes]
MAGDNATVYVRTLHQRNGQIHNQLTVDKSGVQFRDVNTFDIKDPETGAVIFTTHRPHYNMPKGANVLLSSEWIRMDAVAMFLQAEHNLLINYTEGALTLEENSGIY